MATITGSQIIQCSDATNYNDWITWLTNNNFIVGSNSVTSRVDDSANNKVTITYSNFEYEP